MKQIIKKLIRIIANITLVVFIFFLLFYFMSDIRFTSVIPDDAEQYNYSGSWESERVPMVAGRILAQIPYPPPKGEPFTVNAYIYYNLTSIYRPGEFVPMVMDGMIQESGEVAGGNTESPIILPPRINFKYQGEPGPGGKQTIDYVSTSDTDFIQIVGGYRSQSPYDIGIFRIQKIR